MIMIHQKTKGCWGDFSNLPKDRRNGVSRFSKLLACTEDNGSDMPTNIFSERYACITLHDHFLCYSIIKFANISS